MAVSRRVLIVDDDPDIRNQLQTFLSRSGYQVTTAGDGPRALELMRAGQADMVLLDVEMPEMDGVEVLNRIREEGLQVGVIMISDAEGEKRAIQSLELGAADFITKPLNLPYLETSLLAKLVTME